jgi:hypothetical protein
LLSSSCPDFPGRTVKSGGFYPGRGKKQGKSAPEYAEIRWMRRINPALVGKFRLCWRAAASMPFGMFHELASSIQTRLGNFVLILARSFLMSSA